MQKGRGRYELMRGIVSTIQGLERRRLRSIVIPKRRRRNLLMIGRLMPAQIAAKKAEILMSQEYRSLTPEQQTIVRKALRGKEVSAEMASVNPNALFTKVERILRQKIARELTQGQIFSLVRQLPARKQKEVLFAMAGQSDATKAKVWERVETVRRKSHLAAVESKLRDIMIRNAPGEQRINSIVKQLMSISPAQRATIMRAAGISSADAKKSLEIVARRVQETRAYNRAKVGATENYELYLIPKHLRPVYRGMAKAHRESGKERLYSSDFWEKLRQEADKRGMTMQELIQFLATGIKKGKPNLPQ